MAHFSADCPRGENLTVADDGVSNGGPRCSWKRERNGNTQRSITTPFSWCARRSHLSRARDKPPCAFADECRLAADHESRPNPMTAEARRRHQLRGAGFRSAGKRSRINEENNLWELFTIAPFPNFAFLNFFSGTHWLCPYKQSGGEVDKYNKYGLIIIIFCSTWVSTFHAKRDPLHTSPCLWPEIKSNWVSRKIKIYNFLIFLRRLLKNN